MARKVTEQAVTALLRGERFNSKNTTVRVEHGMFAVMSLHGNDIAMVCMRNGGLVVRTGGYETTTTKERLNSLPGVQCYTSKHVLHLNGKPWDRSEHWTSLCENTTRIVERASALGVGVSPRALAALGRTTDEEANAMLVFLDDPSRAHVDLLPYGVTYDEVYGEIVASEALAVSA